MRVYDASMLKELQKNLQHRLAFPQRRLISSQRRHSEQGTAINSKLRPIGAKERQQTAFALAGELGLHHLAHSSPTVSGEDSRPLGLSLFILHRIAALNERHWNKVVGQLFSERGVADNKKATECLSITLSEIRLCLAKNLYGAAGLLLRGAIEIAVQWSTDPQFVVECIHELCFRDFKPTDTQESG
jgi:hypothetical protein